MQTPYNQIMEFCKSKSASELQSKILLHKYYKDYYEVIDNYKKKEKKEPTKEIIEGLENTLLSETTLQGNLKLSEEEIEIAFSEKLKKHDKIMSLKNFGLSVLSGVFASIIFTLLLILVLNLAQNQVKGWINDMYKTQQEIEQTVNEGH